MLTYHTFQKKSVLGLRCLCNDKDINMQKHVDQVNSVATFNTCGVALLHPPSPIEISNVENNS